MTSFGFWKKHSPPWYFYNSIFQLLCQYKLIKYPKFLKILGILTFLLCFQPMTWKWINKRKITVANAIKPSGFQSCLKKSNIVASFVNLTCFCYFNVLVGIERLELSWVAPHAPKACVCTNFTISPFLNFKLSFALRKRLAQSFDWAPGRMTWRTLMGCPTCS